MTEYLRYGPDVEQLQDGEAEDVAALDVLTISSGDVYTYRRDRAVLAKASKAPQLASTAVLRAGPQALRKVGINKTGGPAGRAMQQTNLLGETYWSQGALRFGDHVAKISAAPVSDSTSLFGQGDGGVAQGPTDDTGVWRAQSVAMRRRSG